MDHSLYDAATTRAGGNQKAIITSGELGQPMQKTHGCDLIRMVTRPRQLYRWAGQLPRRRTARRTSPVPPSI